MPQDGSLSSSGRMAVRLAIIGILLGVGAQGIASDIQTGPNGNAGQKCDLFNGQWVPNPSGPAYTNNTCRLIDDFSDCLTNGRPDTGYLYWRWKPYDCELPPFDAKKFLNSARHKTFAFIGDSMLRNQMQSLVCLLSQAEEPVQMWPVGKRISSTIYFPAHNFTVQECWAPFLVKHSKNETNGELHVHLDTLDDTWPRLYHNFDYIVIASGQWYLEPTVIWENGKIIGCHTCAEGYNEIGIDYTYRKGIEMAFDFITSSQHKPLVFFRTWMPDHFENGDYLSWGTCNMTRPYRDGEFAGRPFDRVMRDIEVDEFEKIAGVASKNGVRIELLDTFHLSTLRPDAHPGPYKRYHPFDGEQSAGVQNDCHHLCLPGAIDTWNELVMRKMMDDGAIKSSAYYM